MRTLWTCELGNKVSNVHVVESLEQVADRYADEEDRLLWVCDEHTRHLVPEGGSLLVLPSGEIAKNWSSVEAIVSKALELALARDARFIAVGGGVVCDLTAFAASIYMRGCAVSLVPTTLLAMVDASLGGKSAIDLLDVKNLVGTFFPAEDIFICPSTLSTLPDREFRNGLGEVLKHALLSEDDGLYRFLNDHMQRIMARETVLLERMIVDSLQVKRDYIERDPTETKGIREALNLGHTFAHALESVGKMSRWSHGEAVAWGVVKALQAGVRLGITEGMFADTYVALFDGYGFDSSLKVQDTATFIKALGKDKKRRGSVVRFVLMESQGKHVLRPVPSEIVIEAIS